MTLPDDLTPGEAIELQRILGEVESDPHAQSILEPERGISDGLDSSLKGTLREIEYPTEMIPLFDPISGIGFWNTHHFTLSLEQLKRAHAIFTECIAAKLTAEIERLRGGTQ